MRASLFTSYTNAAEAMFDNITISSVHLAQDATRTLNVHHEDYAQLLADIEAELATNYGSSPTIEETSEGIYEYLNDAIDYSTPTYWTDLKMICEIDTATIGCAGSAILTSAIGRVFGIPTRMVQIDYSGEGGDHFFAEFYWDSNWHIVDPVFTDSNGDAVGCFDDITTVKDKYKDYEMNGCYIIYEFFVAADPRPNDSLDDSVVYYRPYNNQPYYD